MPDNEDYAWLAWLTAHPEEWDESDLSAARFLLRNQQASLDASHPKDREGRLAAQQVSDDLRQAIDRHLSAEPPRE